MWEKYRKLEADLETAVDHVHELEGIVATLNRKLADSESNYQELYDWAERALEDFGRFKR